MCQLDRSSAASAKRRGDNSQQRKQTRSEIDCARSRDNPAAPSAA